MAADPGTLATNWGSEYMFACGIVPETAEKPRGPFFLAAPKLRRRKFPGPKKSNQTAGGVQREGIPAQRDTPNAREENFHLRRITNSTPPGSTPPGPLYPPFRERISNGGAGTTKKARGPRVRVCRGRGRT